MVEELMEGSGALGSALVRELTPFGSHLYLVARSVDEGVELWRTAAGSSSIELVSTNLPGGNGVTPAELTVADGDLYYSGASGASGADRELWRTSGAPAAQQRVADVFPGPDSSDPEGLIALDGTAYFGADDGSGRALWRADAGGATEVGPVAPTRSDEMQLAPPVLAAGGSFYFAGDDGASGIEPWRHTPAPDPSDPVDGGGGGAAKPTVPVAGGGGGAAEPPSLNVAPKLGLRLAGAKRQPIRGARATLRLRATCTVACTVRTAGALLVRAPKAKRPVLRLALPRMRAPLRAGAAKPIVIKLSRKATARLRTALSPPRRRAVATVRVEATGASGKAAANRTVTVG
jgi:ELWxxDGT repeat protein